MPYKRGITGVCFFVCLLFLAAQAEFQPHRYYVERTKASLDIGWKFYKEYTGSPIDASQPGYNDTVWKRTVNIPHSASYDPPDKVSEDASFKGTCWYRKRFTVPVSARHTGKLYIEFEGAMQVADVWLNGQFLGTHDYSGYTYFSFDVTNVVSLNGENLLAVRLTNNYDTRIPPGCNGAPDNGPDYYLFSGLYRDVWLICTDSCHLPLYGQQISFPQGPYPSGAPVRVKTAVRNDYGISKNVTVRYAVATDERDAGRGLLVDSVTGSIGANSTFIFDKTLGPIQDVRLWKLTDPYLYRLFTQVYVDGVLADDYVERFGVRWYTWTPAEKRFRLNDSLVYIQGNSLHQTMPWIQNAVPPSRFYKDIQLAKDMGINLVRCAHYPRDPSYYDACDEQGMLLLVEIPTWGTLSPSYPSVYWTRLDSTVREMIDVGYNHPSIIAWGLFNEPGGDFVSGLTTLNNLAHGYDSTRMTYTANNTTTFSIVNIPDIAGFNYSTESPRNPLRPVNTEYHIGWSYDYAFRGDNNDKESIIAAHFWKDWLTCVAEPDLAGATVWCHADYWSMMNNKPMGVMDHYRIPKSTFYLYRKNWRGVADDNPMTGLTPEYLRLEADTDIVTADSVDCFFVYASLRNANGICVHTGSDPSTTTGGTCRTNVTFSVTGPADMFQPLTMLAPGGKCALLIKSTNTPGSICINASTPGLPPAAGVCVTSVAPDNSSLLFITPVVNGAFVPPQRGITVCQRGGKVRIVFSSRLASAGDIAVINMRGQRVSCPAVISGASADINTRGLAAGLYYLSINGGPGAANVIKRLLITK